LDGRVDAELETPGWFCGVQSSRGLPLDQARETSPCIAFLMRSRAAMTSLIFIVLQVVPLFR
jgi:hypothetical protein